MASVQPISTAAQLLAAENLGRCELVRGELRPMSPAGFEHGWRVIRIAAPLDDFVQKHRCGVVTGAETGFLIERDPDTVLAPDVAYIRAERIPTPAPRGFFPGAPDLAVEVLSPSDSASGVLEKVQTWLDAGVQVVWIVDPRRRVVAAYSTHQPVVMYTQEDALRCDELLPGFELPLASIFRDI